jgi:putative ubiquitin-RnfH superfamily antitoxin RatB of RatAB toxin-antitoxin module
MSDNGMFFVPLLIYPRKYRRKRATAQRKSKVS